MTNDPVQSFLNLERRLLDAEFRRSPEAADLLADDFVEFGSSGQTYRKVEALAAMNQSEPHAAEIERFEVRELFHNVALVTYRLHAERTTLRSSIWVIRNGRWQVVFHQGTLVPEFAAMPK